MSKLLKLFLVEALICVASDGGNKIVLADETKAKDAAKIALVPEK